MQLRNSFCEQKHISSREKNRVFFLFDGEELDLRQTVAELELEDDDVMDAVISTKKKKKEILI